MGVDYEKYLDQDVNFFDLNDKDNFVKLEPGKIPLFNNDQFSRDDFPICSRIYKFDDDHYLLKRAH